MTTELATRLDRIKGHPEYSINRQGDVYSHKSGGTRKLKQCLSNNSGRAYLRVGLSSGGKRQFAYIHKLIAIQYLGHVPCGMREVVDHIDNNRLNNHLSNIQITTTRHNSSKDRGDRLLPLGVYPNRTKYKSSIHIGGKSLHLGTFDTIEEASMTYQEELRKISILERITIPKL